MSQALRLVIFDVDGTLVDSQADILAAMAMAFDSVQAPPPGRAAVLAIVGLSLDQAMFRLAPEHDDATRAKMVKAYKDAYMTLRAKVGAQVSSPLYPGARAALELLHAAPEVLLGVATGKSKRGLDKLLEAHDLGRFFVTQQVADFHPSKPHPSMILQAMADTGALPQDTVMVGDTSFDMDMAAAAGASGLGVSWGYHPRAALGNAAQIIDCFEDLPAALVDLRRAQR